jgi:hypothetical protein
MPEHKGTFSIIPLVAALDVLIAVFLGRRER